MILDKLNKFFKLNFRDKLFFLETVFFLSLSKLVILFIPLKKVAPYLGKVNGNIRDELLPAEMEKANRIKLYIYMAGGNLPWNSVCLDQAMACMILLGKKKIPCSLYLGVKKNEAKKKLDAHAWVMCGDKILMGGERSRQYNVVAWFANAW